MARPLAQRPAFGALRYPNFRWFWLSTSGQSMAEGMQLLILGWLALELTQSVSQLGLTIFFYGIPNLTLVLFGGIFADRINRQKLLIATQTGVTVIIFAIATLTLTNLVAVWQIYTASFLLGTLHAINMPTRLAIVVNLVGRDDIMNAVVLNAAVMSAGRITAPALAGLIIELMGIGPALYITVVCYLLAVGFILLIRNVEQARPAQPPAIFRDLLAGLDYFRKTPVAFTVIGVGFVFGFFAMPYIQVMPSFAQEVLNASAAELGRLITAAGVGSLLANALLSLLGNSRHKNQLLIGSVLLFHLSLFLFAWSQSFWLSQYILLFVGMGSIGYISLGTTVLQLTVPAELQGRVMSLWHLSASLMFIGSLPMFLAADLISWPLVLTGGAAVSLSFALWLVVWRPTLRRLQI